MNREQYINDITHKYELATSEQYREIRELALNYIVKCSNSAITPERIQGMLILVGEIDSWVVDYNRELARRKEQ